MYMYLIPNRGRRISPDLSGSICQSVDGSKWCGEAQKIPRWYGDIIAARIRRKENGTQSQKNLINEVHDYYPMDKDAAVIAKLWNIPDG
jgi:hypothetical protein